MDEEYEINEGIKRRNEKGASYDKPVIDANWEYLKENIKEAYILNGENYESEQFLDTIWDVSTIDLDEKEVSVVVDRDNQLFISRGTRSFVDYKNESVKGMKIPLKCWIHTHPFGLAYFSGTDWRTINTQKPILDSAIVLGNKEKMKWYTLNGKETLCQTRIIELEE
jgi:hypothetical protein